MNRLDTLGRKKVEEEVNDLLEQAAQMRDKNYDGAVKLLLKAAQLLPQLAVENTAGKTDQHVSQKNDGGIYYLSKRGKILYELKRYKEAQECYEPIKQKMPNNTEIHKALGDCLRKLNKFKEASDMYEKALNLYKNDDVASPSLNAALLNSRGLNYLEQEKYTEAKSDFEAAVKMTTKNPNPLYLCNKGHALYALNEKDEALKSFEEANKLVQSGNLTGLTGLNIQYIEKTLKEFIKGVEDLKSVTLSKKDSVMEARELDLIKSGLNALDASQVEQAEKTVIEELGEEQEVDQEQEERQADKPEERQEDKPEEKQKVEQGEAQEEPGKEETKKIPFSIIKAAARLKKIKKSIQEIQEEPKLFEYYDGFMFTAIQSYTTAVVITSGQVLINTSTKIEIEILTSALKLVPLVGSGLSNGLKSFKDFVKEAQITKAATNITKFASASTAFGEIVQDALLDAIAVKRAKIRTQKEDELNNIILPRWALGFKKIIKRITELKGEADKMLYGDRSETPFQIFGCQVANTLISEHIASGSIYGEGLAIKVSPDEKKKRLIEKIKLVFEKSLDKTPLPPDLEDETESRDACCSKESCNMF